MRSFAHEGNIFPHINAVNLASGANPCIRRVDVSGYNHFELLLIKNLSTAVEPVVLTVLQADAVTAGNSKALEIAQGIWVKGHANIEDATGWVKQTPGATPTTNHIWTEAIVETESITLIPFDTAQLDSINGYKWVDASIADTGNGACIGVLAVLCFNPRVTPPPDSV